MGQDPANESLKWYFSGRDAVSDSRGRKYVLSVIGTEEVVKARKLEDWGMGAQLERSPRSDLSSELQALLGL